MRLFHSHVSFLSLGKRKGKMRRPTTNYTSGWEYASGRKSRGKIYRGHLGIRIGAPR